MRPHSRLGGGGQPAGQRGRIAQAVQVVHEVEPDGLGGVVGVGGLQPVPAADGPDQRGVPVHQLVPGLPVAVAGPGHQAGDHRVTAPAAGLLGEGRVRGHGLLLVLDLPTSRRVQGSGVIVTGPGSPRVPGAGCGEPLVEPDGLVSVGPPCGEQLHGQVDVVGAGGAQVRPARAGELGADLPVSGGGDVVACSAGTRRRPGRYRAGCLGGCCRARRRPAGGSAGQRPGWPARRRDGGCGRWGS